MVTRISVDPSQDEAIAKLWNSAAGRVFNNAEVESDRVPVLLTFDMSDFLTDEERSVVAEAVREASAKITGVNWISEVRVPQPLSGRSWRFHVSGHLRADSASVVGPEASEGE